MNDALVEAVRPTIKTREAVNEWLQNQATLFFDLEKAKQLIIPSKVTQNQI